MRKAWIGLGAVLVISGATGLNANAAAPGRGPLTGSWGGDQAILTLTEGAGRLEFGCGHAEFIGPVTLDRHGRFKLKGTYYPAAAGPQVADTPPAQVSARLEGTVEGQQMRLSFAHGQAGAAQTFSMSAGKRQKLIRCL